MKPMILCIALASLASAIPCGAQASPMQVKTAPESVAMLAKRLLAAGGSGHRLISSQEKARSEAILARLNEMDHAGAKALHDGEFVAAERYYREAIKVSSWPPSYFGLGEALANQGRTAEAIEAYRGAVYIRSDNGTLYALLSADDTPPPNGLSKPELCIYSGAGPEVWMKYVLLLVQTGQTAEALTIYNQAIPRIPDVKDKTDEAFLETGALSPAALQAAAHVALGLCATFSEDNANKAMQEFDKARRMQPELALTNYYYGYGWQNLIPDKQAKFGDEQQARAALQKAVKLGKGEVKKAAQKALRVAMKTK